MLVRVVMLGLGLALAVPVWAGETTRLEVSRQDCARLVRAVPLGQAPAEYQPGVDVKGRRVAPADLPDSPNTQIKLPETVTIDLGFNLFDKYGLGPGGLYKGEGKLGVVSVKGDRVYFNDQQLGSADQSAVIDACRKAMGSR